MTAHPALVHPELVWVTAAVGRQGGRYSQVAVLNLSPLQSPKAAQGKHPQTGRLSAIMTYQQIGD